MTELERQLARAERAYLKRAMDEWDDRHTDREDEYISSYIDDMWKSFERGEDGMFFEAMAERQREYPALAVAIANDDAQLGWLTICDIMTDYFIACAKDAYENNQE